MIRFPRSDSGAVTVDFFVLGAGIVGVGLASFAAVWAGMDALVGEPGEALDIAQSFDAAPGTPLTVSFRAGAHSSGNGMRVWFGDTLLADLPAMTPQQLRDYSFDVTAGAPGQNVLRFEATTTTGWDGPLLTAVAVR